MNIILLRWSGTLEAVIVDASSIGGTSSSETDRPAPKLRGNMIRAWDLFVRYYTLTSLVNYEFIERYTYA